MSDERREVRAEPLTEEAWAPFGWLPVDDTDPRDGQAPARLSFAMDDAHVNIIGHARAEVPESAGRLVCQMLFRHDSHTQALMSLDVPAVIAVAPGSVTFDEAGDGEAIRVFTLEPLQPFVLHAGTWHWGPFPISAPTVRLFNVQGLRYAEDNTSVDLGARGLDIEVAQP
ncbi:MAG TPA: ureidoglycolate lyase [Acidimicrobiales bacterium]|nr:ureidoglycolate lyase [Acidimicrobiales bacterium]